MKAGLATSLSIAGVLATGGAALVLNSSILDTASTTKGSPALATVVGVNDQTGVAALGGNSATGSVTASGLADVVNGVEAPLSVDGQGLAPVPAASDAVITSDASPTSETGADGSSQNVKQKQSDVAIAEPTTVAEPGSTSTPATTPPASTLAPTTTVQSVDKQFRIDGVATVTISVNGGKLSVKTIDLVPGSGYKVGKRYSHDGDDVRITFTSASRTVEFSARMVNGQIMAAIGNPRNGNLMPPPGDGDHERREREGREREGRDDHEEHERENDDD